MPESMIVNSTRRQVLLGTGLAILGNVTSPAIASIGRINVRKLSFDNLHTGERLKADYWVDGEYVPDALQDINRLLRDFRTGDVHPIEPKLLDVLSLLRGMMETESDFQVISGYRSPKTNATLHEQSGRWRRQACTCGEWQSTSVSAAVRSQACEMRRCALQPAASVITQSRISCTSMSDACAAGKGRVHFLI